MTGATCEKRGTESENAHKANIVLLDIEGTTTSITFVKDVLFTFVRENLAKHVKANWSTEEFREDLKLLKEQAKEDETNAVDGFVEVQDIDDSDSSVESVVKNVLWQMDLDRKTQALKQLQGHIWREGYKNGGLKGHLYSDVVPAVKSWVENGRQIYIYSSGSVEAQKLLFSHSEQGDVLELISGHFDTEVGPKTESSSYSNIVKKLGCKAEDILFLTDVVKEAEAARDAGLCVILICREGNAPVSDEDKTKFSAISSFQDVVFELSTKRRKLSTENSQDSAVELEIKGNVDNCDNDVEMTDLSEMNSCEAVNAKTEKVVEEMEQDKETALVNSVTSEVRTESFVSENKTKIGNGKTDVLTENNSNIIVNGESEDCANIKSEDSQNNEISSNSERLVNGNTAETVRENEVSSNVPETTEPHTEIQTSIAESIAGKKELNTTDVKKELNADNMDIKDCSLGSDTKVEKGHNGSAIESSKDESENNQNRVSTISIETESQVLCKDSEDSAKKETVVLKEEENSVVEDMSSIETSATTAVALSEAVSDHDVNCTTVKNAQESIADTEVDVKRNSVKDQQVSVDCTPEETATKAQVETMVVNETVQQNTTMNMEEVTTNENIVAVDCTPEATTAAAKAQVETMVVNETVQQDTTMDMEEVTTNKNIVTVDCTPEVTTAAAKAQVETMVVNETVKQNTTMGMEEVITDENIVAVVNCTPEETTAATKAQVETMVVNEMVQHNTTMGTEEMTTNNENIVAVDCTPEETIAATKAQVETMVVNETVRQNTTMDTKEMTTTDKSIVADDCTPKETIVDTKAQVETMAVNETVQQNTTMGTEEMTTDENIVAVDCTPEETTAATKAQVETMVVSETVRQNTAMDTKEMTTTDESIVADDCTPEETIAATKAQVETMVVNETLQKNTTMGTEEMTPDEIIVAVDCTPEETIVATKAQVETRVVNETVQQNTIMGMEEMTTDEFIVAVETENKEATKSEEQETVKLEKLDTKEETVKVAQKQEAIVINGETKEQVETKTSQEAVQDGKIGQEDMEIEVQQEKTEIVKTKQDAAPNVIVEPENISDAETEVKITEETPIVRVVQIDQEEPMTCDTKIHENKKATEVKEKSEAMVTKEEGNEIDKPVPKTEESTYTISKEAGTDTVEKKVSEQHETVEEKVTEMKTQEQDMEVDSKQESKTAINCSEIKSNEVEFVDCSAKQSGELKVVSSEAHQQESTKMDATEDSVQVDGTEETCKKQPEQVSTKTEVQQEEAMSVDESNEGTKEKSFTTNGMEETADQQHKEKNVEVKEKEKSNRTEEKEESMSVDDIGCEETVEETKQCVTAVAIEKEPEIDKGKKQNISKSVTDMTTEKKESKEECNERFVPREQIVVSKKEKSDMDVIEESKEITKKQDETSTTLVTQEKEKAQDEIKSVKSEQIPTGETTNNETKNSVTENEDMDVLCKLKAVSSIQDQEPIKTSSSQELEESSDSSKENQIQTEESTEKIDNGKKTMCTITEGKASATLQPEIVECKPEEKSLLQPVVEDVEMTIPEQSSTNNSSATSLSETTHAITESSTDTTRAVAESIVSPEQGTLDEIASLEQDSIMEVSDKDVAVADVAQDSTECIKEDSALEENVSNRKECSEQDSVQKPEDRLESTAQELSNTDTKSEVSNKSINAEITKSVSGEMESISEKTGYENNLAELVNSESTSTPNSEKATDAGLLDSKEVTDSMACSENHEGQKSDLLKVSGAGISKENNLESQMTVLNSEICTKEIGKSEQLATPEVKSTVLKDTSITSSIADKTLSSQDIVEESMEVDTQVTETETPATSTLNSVETKSMETETSDKTVTETANSMETETIVMESERTNEIVTEMANAMETETVSLVETEVCSNLETETTTAMEAETTSAMETEAGSTMLTTTSNLETETAGRMETETANKTETETAGRMETETANKTETETGSEVKTEMASKVETDTNSIYTDVKIAGSLEKSKVDESTLKTDEREEKTETINIMHNGEETSESRKAEKSDQCSKEVDMLNNGIAEENGQISQDSQTGEANKEESGDLGTKMLVTECAC